MNFKRIIIKKDLNGITFANNGKFVKVEDKPETKKEQPKEQGK